MAASEGEGSTRGWGSWDTKLIRCDGALAGGVGLTGEAEICLREIDVRKRHFGGLRAFIAPPRPIDQGRGSNYDFW